MSTLLVHNAQVLVTMDPFRREIAGGGFYAVNGRIEQIGGDLPETADHVVDAAGTLVTPGLINTHHHMFQSLTRTVPAGQDALLFGWLKALYPIWARYTPDDIRVSTQLAMAELALSGCTLSSDHLYLFPNGARLSDSIDGAADVGIRFHPTRGAMSIGETKGGLPPDSLVECEEDILEDMIDVVDRFHETGDGAMVQIGLAPCSPFSVSRDLMRDTALLAREKGVMLHTHLAENAEDVAYSKEKFGCRPGEYAEQLGWIGQDVWHAHCVELDHQEINLFAMSRTGIAHCPCSNCRLGSGIAPLGAMIDAGIPVGLGVDGSASNDSGHLLAEARQAMLLQRVARGADAMSARSALELATLGGAKVLNRADLGSLEVGKRADFTLWDTHAIPLAGAWDPVAALVLCGPISARDVYVEGRAVVRKGRLVGVDQRRLIEDAGERIARLMR